MDNEGKLRNGFIALEDTMLHCEFQLEVPLCQPLQAHDYIPPIHSYEFLFDDGGSSYSLPFKQVPFEGMSDPSLHPLIINPHLKIRDALGVDIVFDDAPSLLAPLRENDRSKKLVVKASCEFEHNTIVVSNDIFVGEYSLQETYLEESHVDDCVKVMPHDLKLVDPVSIECPP